MKALAFIFLLSLLYIGLGQEEEQTFVDPSISKCLTVKCSPGSYCFHGRCKQIDYDCIDKICEKGWRCQKGQCIKQLVEPKMQLCKPLGFNQQTFSCGTEQQERCKNSKVLSKTICAYYDDGTTEQFSNECQACKQTVQPHSYFKSKCKWAPQVCKVTEQCLNGTCVNLFKEKDFQNMKSCNKHSQCKINQRCGGHRCIDRRDLFNYLNSKAQVSDIQLII